MSIPALKPFRLWLDDEVTAFFSPHAAGKGYMFIVVFGKRRQHGSG